MPGIDLGMGNSLRKETKSLSSWSLHFSVYVGEGRQTINKHTHILHTLSIGAKGDREYRVGTIINSNI